MRLFSLKKCQSPSKIEKRYENFSVTNPFCSSVIANSYDLLLFLPKIFKNSDNWVHTMEKISLLI